jgi:hypothetical protein
VLLGRQNRDTDNASLQSSFSTTTTSFVMEEGYEQSTSAIGSLRSILQSYPFSVGIFREILQNSDDAGASKQVRDPSNFKLLIVTCFTPDIRS